MLRPTLLPTVLAVFLASVTIRASPIDIDQDLVPRGNHWNLNCSNAPGVTAGR